MDQSAQAFNLAALLIPLLLALIPAALFFAGYKLSRSAASSYVSGAFHWFGGHGVTVVFVAVITVLEGVFFPHVVLEHLPLIVTILYLIAGLCLRSPFLFTLGLATVGVWKLCISLWEAVSGVAVTMYALPHDPFWYLLAAVVLFALHFVPRPNALWEDAATSIVTLSGGYLMGSLMLLAVGGQGLLAGIGLPPYIWGGVLAAVGVLLFWCSRVIDEPVLTIASILGLIGGVYSFISRYPWS